MSFMRNNTQDSHWELVRLCERLGGGIRRPYVDGERTVSYWGERTESYWGDSYLSWWDDKQGRVCGMLSCVAFLSDSPCGNSTGVEPDPFARLNDFLKQFSITYFSHDCAGGQWAFYAHLRIITLAGRWEIASVLDLDDGDPTRILHQDITRDTIVAGMLVDNLLGNNVHGPLRDRIVDLDVGTSEILQTILSNT